MEDKFTHFLDSLENTQNRPVIQTIHQGYKTLHESKSKGMQFVRYGGLSSVKQKGYSKDIPTFHAPPVRRGIYAFPANAVELFLLGKGEFDQRRMEWKKDKEGKKRSHKDYDSEMKDMTLWKDKKTEEQAKEIFEKEGRSEAYEKFEDENMFLAQHAKRKKFSYNGDIWHHLNVPPHAVLQRKGDWIKTSFQDYEKAFKKDRGVDLKLRQREGYGFSKDHLEVFIEKV